MTGKVRITLIDDDKDLVLSTKSFLERRDFSVSVAFSGKEALEVIKKENPALIILDITMPDMDGNKVLDRLKKDTNTENIPVIMLTAKDAQTDRIQALKQGAYEYISQAS